MTYAQARRRVDEARRAHHAAMDTRERNRSAETAADVAIAQLHLDDAQRALVRTELL